MYIQVLLVLYFVANSPTNVLGRLLERKEGQLMGSVLYSSGDLVMVRMCVFTSHSCVFALTRELEETV